MVQGQALSYGSWNEADTIEQIRFLRRRFDLVERLFDNHGVLGAWTPTQEKGVE